MATQSGKSRPNARARSAALRAQQRKKEKRQRMLLFGGIGTVVVAVIAVMVIIYATRSDKKVAASSPASAAVVKDVTTVPAAAFSKVDTSKVVSPPSKISGDPLTFDGKPGILYYGAEYCPFCAAERWPLVVALSRFGTWSNLQQTTSGPAPEPYPGTPTFSFYGARYTSPYLALQTVETKSNQPKNGDYTTLQKPSDAQQAIVTKYNSKDTIPFIDFGNKYLIQGATYSSDVLVGKSMDEIAAGVPDASSDLGKSVLGTANTMTAAVCEMTGGKPGSVCDTPTITKLRNTIKGQK